MDKQIFNYMDTTSEIFPIITKTSKIKRTDILLSTRGVPYNTLTSSSKYVSYFEDQIEKRNIPSRVSADTSIVSLLDEDLKKSMRTFVPKRFYKVITHSFFSQLRDRMGTMHYSFEALMFASELIKYGIFDKPDGSSVYMQLLISEHYERRFLKISHTKAKKIIISVECVIKGKEFLPGDGLIF